MPRAPEWSPAVSEMPGAVFSPIANQLEARADVCPLHVGDTWLEPFCGGRMEDLHTADHPGMHRYSPTRGEPALIDALVEKLRGENGLACERESVIVTAGATGALSSVFGTLVAPGEEVLILAPFWPLIRGIVQTFRGEPVEVPFYDRVDSPEAAVAAVRAHLSPKTVALYVSTPSNPSGCVLEASWLEALADLARREDLWLISDEVYEKLVYRGEHVSIGRFAPERTLTSFSFSKAYGMAGNRAGYLVGPEAVLTQALKISTHTFYAAPTASQAAGLAALESGDDWLDRARERYREVGDATARLLGLPPPGGSTFHLLDVRAHLDDRGIWGFLADCVQDGIALAPGASCGAAYADCVRLCYTAAPPEAVTAAVGRLAKRLA